MKSKVKFEKTESGLIKISYINRFVYIFSPKRQTVKLIVCKGIKKIFYGIEITDKKSYQTYGIIWLN